MPSFLSNELRESALIRFYFGSDKDFHLSAVKKAYLDFCRTLRKKEAQIEKFQPNGEDFVCQRLLVLTRISLSNQQQFDIFHKETCEQLLEIWSQLRYGQVQKWINMTLKYWLVLGEEKIDGIERNAKYFHIPIDSIVQKNMFDETNPSPWSKMSYEEYRRYQDQFQEAHKGVYPIIEEIKCFNTN